MNELRTYFYALDPAGRARFARAIGTTVGYMPQLINGVRLVNPETAMRAEIASAGVLRAEVLCPSAPWRQFLRVRAKRARRSTKAE